MRPREAVCLDTLKNSQDGVKWLREKGNVRADTFHHSLLEKPMYIQLNRTSYAHDTACMLIG